MLAPSGYVLCGTPRTGSTLLCNLLASTGVLGRPESYFRAPDEQDWARRLGLPLSGERVRDYREFARAVRAIATTDNGIFAARIMWGSLERVMRGLEKAPGQSDSAVLEATFGRLAFVHIVRDDVVGQAVSWARAEQTGYWQQGDVVVRSPAPDLRQMKSLVGTIREHNTAWQLWFSRNHVQQIQITYEDLVAETRETRETVERIAAALEVTLPATWQPVSPHRKQADRTNEEWVALLRAALADGG